MTNVFTYGSLMYPEVFGPVTLASPRCHRARLDGWSRHAIRARTYPAAGPASGASIEGVLWMEFEGDEYVRQQVFVTLPDGERVNAQIYRWLDSASLLPSDWSSDTFERHYLSDFFRIHGA